MESMPLAATAPAAVAAEGGVPAPYAALRDGGSCEQRPADAAPQGYSLHCGGGAGSGSNTSSCTDLCAVGAELQAQLDAAHRTHHLLKHCLSNNQRGDALAQFGVTDVREAAKEISRMGQRELQGKFRAVYGTATHSNNNDWLRRKLYEAIGAAPLKPSSKGKTRKPSAPKSRSRPAQHGAGAHDAQLGSPRGGSGKRSPKGSPSALHLASKHRRLPSSPQLGGSVVEMSRFGALLSHDNTSESEDGGPGHEGSEDLHGSTDCDTPRSCGARQLLQHHHMRPIRTRVGLVPVRPLGAPSGGHSPFADRPLLAGGMHQGVVAPAPEPVLAPPAPLPQYAPAPAGPTPLTQRASLPAALSGFLPLDGMRQSANDWNNEAWELGSLSAELAVAAAVRAEPLPREEIDNDVMMLSLDLSAFDGMM